MSGWTAIVLAALVAARAPKGAFPGGDGAASPASPPAATVVADSPAVTGTTTVAETPAGTDTVASAEDKQGQETKSVKVKPLTEEDEKSLAEKESRKERLVAFWKKTPHYFIGTYGIVSVLCMLMAMYWLARYAKRRERSVQYFRALLATVAALVLADWTYFDIAVRLEIDRSAEEAAGRAWQEEVKAKEVKEATTIGERVEMKRFAEESDSDRKILKEAGQKGESQKDELDKALEQVQAPPGEEPDQEPEWKKRGKVERTASTNKTGVVDAGFAKGEVKQEKPWRLMTQNDMVRSTRFGRILLSLSKLSFWLALTAFVLDYLSRFNLTFDYFFPLPLALLWVDRIMPKRLTTFCRNLPRQKLVPYLEDLLRKGETFIYFGERDPVPDRDRLYRFSFGRLHVLPVRKFVCSREKPWDGTEFVLESSWFGRGCFVIEGLSEAERLREDMVEFLVLRQRSRAWAAQTVHFVWDHPSPPPFAVMDEMLACGRNSNLKMVILSPAVRDEHAKTMFEEAYEEFPEPRPSPAMLERLIRGGLADTLTWALFEARNLLIRAAKAVHSRILHVMAGRVKRPTKDLAPEKKPDIRSLPLENLPGKMETPARSLSPVSADPATQKRSEGPGTPRQEPSPQAKPAKPDGKEPGRLRPEDEAKPGATEMEPKPSHETVNAIPAGPDGGIPGDRKSVEASPATAQRVETEVPAEKPTPVPPQAPVPQSQAEPVPKKPTPAPAKAVPEPKGGAGQKDQEKAGLEKRAKTEESKGVGMFGKLIAWHRERKEKKAAAKAKRDAEWKRILEARKLAAEKAQQAAAAKPAAKPQTKTPEDKKPGEKAGPDVAASPAAEKKDGQSAPVADATDAKADGDESEKGVDEGSAQGKSLLQERIRAKMAQRKGRHEGKKVDLAALMKAKQAAAQAKAGGSPAKDEPAASADTAEARSAEAEKKAEPAAADTGAADREAKEKAELEARIQAEVQEKLRKETEEAERRAKADAEDEVRKMREQVEAAEKARAAREEQERLTKEKSEREARERAEAEARNKAEAEEKLRREREAVERQAKAKVEEEGRKAREQADAAEKERLAKEKSEREARERAEAEARSRAEAEEKLRREREEVERQAKAKAEEEGRKAREQADAAEKERLAREEADRLAKEKSEREARERAEEEARRKAEVEEKLRKEREEVERQAKAKAEEDAKKAREAAEAAEKIRLEKEDSERKEREKAEREARIRAEVEERLRREREESERLAREKSEREARERAELEARIRAELEEKLRKEREEAERQAKVKAEEDAKKAREIAEAAEKSRVEPEEGGAEVAEEAPPVSSVAEQAAGEPGVSAPPPTKPEAPVGGKRIIIVKKGTKGVAPKTPASPSPSSEPEPAPAAAQGAPEPEVETPPPVQASGPAVEDTDDAGPKAPVVRSEPAPEAPPPREGRRIVVVKKQAATRDQSSPPRMAPPPQQVRAPVPPPEPESPSDEIRFHCPHCGQHLAAPPQLGGRQLPCTQCRRQIVVPMPGGQLPPGAVAPSSSTIMAAPMPPVAPQPQVRVSFVPPKQPTYPPPGQLRPPAFGPAAQPQPQQSADSPFKFFCPLCGQKLSAKREWVGRSLKCPACQRPVVIPSPA